MNDSASILPGMNILQVSWFWWSEYWANDLLAMATAILCSQQMIQIIRGLYRHSLGGSVVAIATSDAARATLELPQAKAACWDQVLLNFGYAVLFPITTAFHPLVSRSNIIGGGTLFPSLPHLVGQTSVFLAIDHSSWRFFATQFREAFEQRGSWSEEGPEKVPSSALEIATDFTASTTTLILTITIIQLSWVVRCFTGGLHFVAVLCWLLFRTRMETRI